MQEIADKKFAETEIQALLGHFQILLGPYGLYEHAMLRKPLLKEGYCTDDNARAVQCLVYLAQYVASEHYPLLDQLLAPCWQFLKDAQLEDGTYRNLRTAEGEWEARDVSDDMYARVLRALVAVRTLDFDITRRQEAVAMQNNLLATLPRLMAARAWAENLIGLAPMTPDQVTTEEMDLMRQNTGQILALWQKNSAPQWAWFEKSMTYANALFPHALLASLHLDHQFAADIAEVLQHSTHFLIASTIQDNVFIPIGSRGWYPKGGVASHDNQQAIEAGTMFDFLLDYQRHFPDRLSAEIIAAPYLWFYGQNTSDIVLIDPVDFACYDGLFTEGPNRNCGAESLLAGIWAEIRLQSAPHAISDYIATRKAALRQTAQEINRAS